MSSPYGVAGAGHDQLRRQAFPHPAPAPSPSAASRSVYVSPHQVAGSGHQPPRRGPLGTARQAPSAHSLPATPPGIIGRVVQPVFIPAPASAPPPVVVVTSTSSPSPARSVVYVSTPSPNQASFGASVSVTGRHYTVGATSSLALIILGLFLAVVGVSEPTGVLFGIGIGTLFLGIVLGANHQHRQVASSL